MVGGVIAHVMYVYTMEMPPPHPLPRFIPVPIRPLPLPPILAPHTPSSQHRSPGGRATTRSHSTGYKSECHGRKWFE